MYVAALYPHHCVHGGIQQCPPCPEYNFIPPHRITFLFISFLLTANGAVFFPPPAVFFLRSLQSAAAMPAFRFPMHSPLLFRSLSTPYAAKQDYHLAYTDNIPCAMSFPQSVASNLSLYRKCKTRGNLPLVPLPLQGNRAVYLSSVRKRCIRFAACARVAVPLGSIVVELMPVTILLLIAHCIAVRA